MRVLMSMASWKAVQTQADLQEQGFHVTTAEDGETVFDSLTLLGRPIVILETDLPDMNWADGLVKLRQRSRNMTILALNTQRREADRIKAIELGADDVIDPAMDGREVAARIRAVAARRAGHSGPNIDIGPIRIRMKERNAYWGPQKIDLTPTQYSLFETICLAAPYSIGKEIIMAELYGVEEGCDPMSIRVFISHLRARLMAAGAPANVIETVLGRGYRLVQVESIDAPTFMPQNAETPQAHSTAA